MNTTQPYFRYQIKRVIQKGQTSRIRARDPHFALDWLRATANRKLWRTIIAQNFKEYDTQERKNDRRMATRALR